MNLITKTTFTWTQERIDHMLDGFQKGLSHSRIAAEMGITRNMVMSKLHRMRSTQCVRAKVQMVKSKPPIYKTQPIKVDEIKEEPSSRNCSIMQLNSHRCHWPIGDGPPFVYCGAVVHDRSYCHHHYVKSLRREER